MKTNIFDEEFEKEKSYIQAEIEFKENFELEMEFSRKPAKLAVQNKDGFLNYGAKYRTFSYKGVIQE